MASPLDIAKVRANFPGIASGFIFADNAGGSQSCKQVIDGVTDWLTNTNAQLGATYSVSAVATKRASEGPEAAAKLFGAASADEITLGYSTTQNYENLGRALDESIKTGDEFILTGEHEANVGTWKKLAQRRGAVVKFWPVSLLEPNNPYSVTYKTEDLLPLITSHTRIVAFSACSNILGSITPVKEIVQAIRSKAKDVGAQKVEISVDCVAYGPHRKIDVVDWDVDYAALSFYKIYGPHNAALYTRSSVLKSSVTKLSHHFLPTEDNGYMLAPGGHGYELAYGSAKIIDYLLSLAPTLSEAWDAIAEYEQTQLVVPLLQFLTSEELWNRGVRIVGDAKPGPSRAPTVSFVVTGEKPLKSQFVVEEVDKAGNIGIRYGHFYAYKVVSDLPNMDIKDGIIRVSLVHYNTLEEVNNIINVLKKILL
ncbi:pyridoxal phosphate-dependent transferase [Flagelloscypha sp. PMI_526]|nr:pyridoxal phosphate-dependent transferase [Flagelloscypha sp. PMI_526]